MSRFDIEDLERHHLVRRLEAGRAEYEMDFAATRIVADIIAKHAQSFSYIIKSGAHFPYTDKAAPSAQRFQPALDIGETTRGTERTLNSYLNALSWTVDEYLVNLIEVLEATGERVLVIYTSDHGQSLLERHKGELHLGFPHATPVDPPVYQAMVPLILFGVGDGVQERVSANCHTALRDRVSGFEIFPSVLVMAGYDSEELRRYYHHTLFDAQAPRDGRVFASGNIFGRGSGYQNELIRNNPSFFLNPFVLPEKVGRKGAAGAE
jgi:glucan phosphoethanolaminetransferase (alkaline phosphatase superfamily)